MSYGIEITSGIGSLQISSSRPMSGFKVVDSGTSSQIPGVTGYTPDTNVLIRYQPPENEGQFIFINKLANPWQVIDGTNSPIAVDWVKIEPFSVGGTASTSGYGLQVFNINNDLVYDSVNAGNQGISLKEYALEREFSGDFTSDLGPITTDLSEYVSVATIFYTSGATEYGFYFANNATYLTQQYTGIYYSGVFYVDTVYGSFSAYLENLSEIFTASIGSI